MDLYTKLTTCQLFNSQNTKLTTCQLFNSQKKKFSKEIFNKQKIVLKVSFENA